MRWNDRSDWIQSAELAHEPIVSAETFARAEAIRASHGRHEAAAKVRRTQRPYMLRRLVRCGLCGRAMEGTWNNGQAHYRCRFGTEYAATKGIDHPKTVYLREALIVPTLDDWLARSFEPDQIEVTIKAMVAAAETDPSADARLEGARRKLVDCEARLARHRAALEPAPTPPSSLSGSPRCGPSATPPSVWWPRSALTSHSMSTRSGRCWPGSTCGGCSPRPTRPGRPRPTPTWASPSCTTRIGGSALRA
jgi:hypothetical protein